MASTSAAAASPPIDLEELDAIFSWNPPRLVLVPAQTSDRKPSTSTRKPAFFDLHFSDRLILKHVVRLPSLVQSIARTVDTALDATKNALPELSGILRIEVIRQLAGFQECHVRNEKGVSHLYSHTTAVFCPIVASTLALHPTAPRWMPLIRWTEALSSSRHAIVDAELTFFQADTSKGGKQREEIIQSMESGRRRIVETMRQKALPLMTFEFKSLSAGPVEVMTAVRKLGDFNWTYCGSLRNPCRIPGHKEIRDMVDAIVPGPDARHPPWDIQVCTYALHPALCLMSCL